MRSVTEFANFTLNQGLTKKAALVAEGKTPEEIQASLGEAFKYEGDKLKYFINAMDIASQNAEGLKRVLVVSLAEGENAPAKATKVEELHYVPEFHFVPRPPAPEGDEKGGKGGRGKGRGGRGDRGGRGGPRGDKGEKKDKPPQA